MPDAPKPLDYPTARRLQNANPDLDHDMRCSYEQTEGAMLCDCGALEKEWKRMQA